MLNILNNEAAYVETVNRLKSELSAYKRAYETIHIDFERLEGLQHEREKQLDTLESQLKVRRRPLILFPATRLPPPNCSLLRTCQQERATCPVHRLPLYRQHRRLQFRPPGCRFTHHNHSPDRQPLLTLARGPLLIMRVRLRPLPLNQARRLNCHHL